MTEKQVEELLVFSSRTVTLPDGRTIQVRQPQVVWNNVDYLEEQHDISFEFIASNVQEKDPGFEFNDAFHGLVLYARRALMRTTRMVGLPDGREIPVEAYGRIWEQVDELDRVSNWTAEDSAIGVFQMDIKEPGDEFNEEFREMVKTIYDTMLENVDLKTGRLKPGR